MSHRIGGLAALGGHLSSILSLLLNCGLLTAVGLSYLSCNCVHAWGIARYSELHHSKCTPCLSTVFMSRGTSWCAPKEAKKRRVGGSHAFSVWHFDFRLHSHCNDPSLDDPIPQEYALYLCPTGHLFNCLQEFRKESKRQCGKNRAHEIFPHITLCDFFTVRHKK